MVHLSRKHNDRDLHRLIQQSLQEIPDFENRVEVVGRINKIHQGIWHDNYCFFIRSQNLPVGQNEQAYVLRLLQQRYKWQQGSQSRDRLVGEAETLRALMISDFAHPTPELVSIVKGNDLEPIGMIETALPGVSLDRFRDRSTLKRIGQVAANVHHLDTELFTHLSNCKTRTQHIQVQLGKIDADLFAEFPLAVQVRDWIASYAPTDDGCCVLHGDLLPQNLLLNWQISSDAERQVSVVDWEMTQIGDPAYDLAIVSRGNRKVLGVNNGLQVLLDDYANFGGRKISMADVRVHELLLVMHWLNESWREYQESAPRGHGPEFYEEQLRSLFRRTTNRSVR
ncbi:phosphotransferase family protein [Roseiconus lacunae]|uniref:phosphotransferase family protein n=1 Tax=Roseiconus lacunae TaxID=2605694 RepID=UPI001E42260E|nr:aminoglycoside phosphotransferase family protein [Roseiconus lacunae]MCD0458599.1 aminoglycoside phosphotransferase family protein [Roseiconus lacunae]